MTPHVGKPTDRSHSGNEDEKVTQADPGHGPDAGVKGPLQRRESHGDDAGVQLAHERPNAHSSDGQPERVGSAPDDVGTPGLDHQAVPPDRSRIAQCAHPAILRGGVQER